MKNLILILSLIICLSSYSQGIVGNDKDSFGCIGSAGYTYSKFKKECIRVFELDLKLNSVANSKDSYSSITGLVFNEDKSSVEVFLPSGVVVLKKKNISKTKKYWQSKSHTLILDKKYKLYEGKRLIFQE